MRDEAVGCGDNRDARRVAVNDIFFEGRARAGGGKAHTDRVAVDLVAVDWAGKGGADRVSLEPSVLDRILPTGWVSSQGVPPRRGGAPQPPAR